MLGQEIIYAPCPCGSGKKFKFCCFKEYRSKLVDGMTLAEVTQLVRCEKSGIKSGELSFDPKSEHLHDKGIDAMKALDFAKARELFKRSREIDPTHSASWNNEASCAWEMGDYAAACDIQREGNAKMSAVDSFGLARLAVYAHVTGHEDEAIRSLDAALAVPPISVYGALEVCFALALYHRHRDIIAYVAKSGMADSDRLAFYTGIAHANLDETGQATLDLRKTGDSQHSLIPARYLDALADDVLPWTADGDEWPYFDRLNFRPARNFSDDVTNGVDPFVRCPKVLAEDCIAFLLADNSLATEDALTLVRKLSSERARRMATVLERMVKSEEDCVAQEKAELQADVDAKGCPRMPFYVYPLELEIGELTEEEDDLVCEADELVLSEVDPASDDYSQFENVMRELVAAHPRSAYVNLAYFGMLFRHDKDLAVGLLESFCVRHPDDVRAAGALLEWYVNEGRLTDAVEVIDRFSVPTNEVPSLKCLDWVVALQKLHDRMDFRDAYPSEDERIGLFLSKFKRDF